MATINLLTIHYGKCYGAVMQTYATCQLLENAGHRVNVINLVHPRLQREYLNVRKLTHLVREFQFMMFKRKYFSSLTPKTYDSKKLRIPEADITIVGSDQVWNRDITGEFGNVFYLDFVDKKQKKISFSSSFGKNEWCEDKEYTAKISGLLKQFDALSVRERTGVEILDGIFHLSSTLLVDPTLGYGNFKPLIYNTKPKKCIFTFLLNKSNDALARAIFVSQQLNIPLYKQNKIDQYFKTGPRHWLTNIFNSAYVITDSFHGLALSILFHKQFFVFCADERKFTRLQNLLNLLHLEERFVKSIEDFQNRKESLMEPINYDIVDTILRKEQNKVQQFIKNHIGNA